MHQLSFSAFAASRKAPPVPVTLCDPLKTAYQPSCLIVREDVWDESCFGYSLDATRHIPTGGHDSILGSSSIIVAAHTCRWY